MKNVWNLFNGATLAFGKLLSSTPAHFPLFPSTRLKALSFCSSDVVLDLLLLFPSTWPPCLHSVFSFSGSSSCQSFHFDAVELWFHCGPLFLPLSSIFPPPLCYTPTGPSSSAFTAAPEPLRGGRISLPYWVLRIWAEFTRSLPRISPCLENTVSWPLLGFLVSFFLYIMNNYSKNWKIKNKDQLSSIIPLLNNLYRFGELLKSTHLQKVLCWWERTLGQPLWKTV